jgi:hypothetical protein
MGLTVSVVIQIIYVGMQLVSEIWASPIGDMFRDWYKQQTPIVIKNFLTK